MFQNNLTSVIDTLTYCPQDIDCQMINYDFFGYPSLHFFFKDNNKIGSFTVLHAPKD